MFCLTAIKCASIDNVNLIRYRHELSKEYHLKKGKEFIDQQKQKKKNLNGNVAKNTIIFLGDGMSLPTVAASRIYNGGVERSLSFEQFPYVAMSKTYCVDHQIADSACTATGKWRKFKNMYRDQQVIYISAYLSGIKANLGTIGVNSKVPFGSCSSASNVKTHVDSIANWALNAEKSIGLVTTTRGKVMQHIMLTYIL